MSDTQATPAMVSAEDIDLLETITRRYGASQNDLSVLLATARAYLRLRDAAEEWRRARLAYMDILDVAGDVTMIRQYAYEYNRTSAELFVLLPTQDGTARDE